MLNKCLIFLTVCNLYAQTIQPKLLVKTNIYKSIVFSQNPCCFSDPSNLVTFSATNGQTKIELEWTKPKDSSITNYQLWCWIDGHEWTNKLNTGLIEFGIISLLPPPKTNHWITVSNAYFVSGDIKGPWVSNTWINANLTNFTGMKFFRGLTNKSVWISTNHIY